MTAALKFLLHKTVDAALYLLLAPTSSEIRKIVREELDRAGLIVPDSPAELMPVPENEVDQLIAAAKEHFEIGSEAPKWLSDMIESSIRWAADCGMPKDQILAWIIQEQQ